MQFTKREFFAETADVDLCGFPLGDLARCCVVSVLGLFEFFSMLYFFVLQRGNGCLGGGDIEDVFRDIKKDEELAEDVGLEKPSESVD